MFRHCALLLPHGWLPAGNNLLDAINESSNAYSLILSTNYSIHGRLTVNTRADRLAFFCEKELRNDKVEVGCPVIKYNNNPKVEARRLYLAMFFCKFVFTASRPVDVTATPD